VDPVPDPLLLRKDSQYKNAKCRMPPSSGPKNMPKKKLTGRRWKALFHSCLFYTSALNIEAICSSEASTDFKQTTWRCTSEHRFIIAIPVKTPNHKI
jgi:hypothetical protein